MSFSNTVKVRVAEIHQKTPLIKHFVLKPIVGDQLPAFSGGSHVVVNMHGRDRVYRNPYSLLSPPYHQESYEIAVRRDASGRGGSMHMHDQVTVGSELEITHPVNLFNRDKLGRKHVLMAGGIGITPFMSMMEELKEGSAPYELHYSVRSREHAAFADRLIAAHGERIHLYCDSEQQAIDFDGLLQNQPLGTHVYVCGPGGMIDRVVSGAKAAGWADSHIHWEQFSAPPVGEPFDVYLSKSNRKVHVEPDQSLLEAIEAAGVDAPYLCRGGVCGECKTRVLESDGTILHHDDYLSAEEKASGQFIMPCVSRAACKTLVLDL